VTSTPISDEHSALLWQTCAYADDLRAVAGMRPSDTVRLEPIPASAVVAAVRSRPRQSHLGLRDRRALTLASAHHSP